MILISRNSSKITNLDGGSPDFGFSTEVIYKKNKYIILYDGSNRGDGLILEISLKLKKDDVLALKGGLEPPYCGVYIKESVADKENLHDLIIYFKGIREGAFHVEDIAGIGGKVSKTYFTGAFASERIIEPEKKKELKILVSAAKKLEQEGLSPKQILKKIENIDKVCENDILLFEREDELKSLCGWK